MQDNLNAILAKAQPELAALQTRADFEAAKAEPTVEATKRLLVSLPAAVAEFRKAVDPAKDHDGGGDGAGGGAGGGPSQAR